MDVCSVSAAVLNMRFAAFELARVFTTKREMRSHVQLAHNDSFPVLSCLHHARSLQWPFRHSMHTPGASHARLLAREARGFQAALLLRLVGILSSVLRVSPHPCNPAQGKYCLQPYVVRPVRACGTQRVCHGKTLRGVEACLPSK